MLLMPRGPLPLLLLALAPSLVRSSLDPAIGSVSTAGFLCFSNTSVATLYSPCGPADVILGAAPCAGALNGGQYYCPTFSRAPGLAPFTTDGLCYDSKQHGAAGTGCPAAAMQSDDTTPLTQQCNAVTNPTTGGFPQYVWWCPVGTAQTPSPPSPPLLSPPPSVYPVLPVQRPFLAACQPASGTPGQCTCTGTLNVQFNDSINGWVNNYQADANVAPVTVVASGSSCDVCGKATYCPANYDHINGWDFTSIDPDWFNCVSGGATGSVGGSNQTYPPMSYNLCQVVPSTALLCLCIIVPIALILLFLALSCYLWPLCPIYQRRQRRKEKAAREQVAKSGHLKDGSSEIRGIPSAQSLPLSKAQRTAPQSPGSANRVGSLALDMRAIETSAFAEPEPVQQFAPY